jgi:hypothetical protein
MGPYEEIVLQLQLGLIYISTKLQHGLLFAEISLLVAKAH